jgi:hypothetical protein
MGLAWEGLDDPETRSDNPDEKRPWIQVGIHLRMRETAMRRVAGVLAVAFGSLVQVGTVDAQVYGGPQVSVGTDSALGVGARMIFPLRSTRLGVDGAFDGNFFFGGGSLVDNWIDVNLNGRLPIPLSPDFTMRLGTGLNATFISLAEQTGVTTELDTELGWNILLSVERPEGRVGPFAEARLILGGAEQLVFTAGYTFGGGAVAGAGG